MNIVGRFFMATHVALFRATGGKFGGRIQGAPVLLLTTTGNKTGKKRTVPVMSFEQDGQRMVIASAAGAPTHPAWYKNLSANPNVEVEVVGERYEATAETLPADQREKLWPELVKRYPGFGGYQAKTSREIPIVALKRK
jgi:deazaflavin-dependent oxidoreductase (nitroreductase family)